MAQTQTSQTLAAVLGTNQIVERCMAKMATDVTLQVRDKLIEIILAVLARECDGFDEEAIGTLRRFILAAIPDMTATVEKRVKTQAPEELDAEGNPIKKQRKVRTPKEPKAPKAPLTEEEKAERKAQKAALRADLTLAKKAEKEAAKAVEKEAQKAARKAEREAAKAAKPPKEKAEKPTKEPKAPKESRLPIPWCGKRIDGRCEALRSYHNLFAQCTADKPESGNNFCASCEKAGAPFGTVAMREACGAFDYTAPNGKRCVRLANVIDKFGLVDAAEQAFHEEAAKHDITIPHEHLEKEVKQRGRPAKIATADTTPASSRNASDGDDSSDAEGETAKSKKQQRKKVVKAVDAGAAPKKRGRPAKAKEPTVEATDDLIANLALDAQSSSGSVTATPRAVTPASARAPAPAAASTPRKVQQQEVVDDELTEDEVEVVVAATPKKSPANKPLVAPAAPKKLAAAKPKRKEVTIRGEKFWVELFTDDDGDEQVVNVRCSDNAAFQGEDYVGLWNNESRSLEVD
jgi:hypothetical protein